jgi:hypothetical protein
MGKFEKEEVSTPPAHESAGSGPVLRLALPASGKLPQGEQLRALVRFAISQGYYERWNKPSDSVVRSCSSTDFPTDRGWVSR